MRKSIAIVDYGVGNLLSVWRALSACNANVEIATTPEQIKKAGKIVLPGVGSFGHCMNELIKRNLKDSLLEYINTGKPLLGICVGMQILHTFGEEFGYHEGLGIIPGKVSKIPSQHATGLHKIPYIGWAELNLSDGAQDKNISILKKLEPGNSFYFVHSFMGIPEDQKHCLATYDYNGIKVTAMVGKDNVIGCQFHPEKSGKLGLDLLSNFIQM